MKTVLFLSVSVDGLIADKDGIPFFPEGAWQDWCSLVNDADNVIAGRSSFEQLQNDEILIDLQPVAFGVGTPVFGDVLDLTELKLIDSRPLNENALRLRYQVL